MLATKGMALMIFTGLNVLAVSFLLYVLVQFWKEGHKSKWSFGRRSRLAGLEARPKVVLAMTPIGGGESRRENGRLIEFRVRGESAKDLADLGELRGHGQGAPKSVAR